MPYHHRPLRTDPTTGHRVRADPRIAGWADQILTPIDDSIAEGALPATVRSFTALHELRRQRSTYRRRRPVRRHRCRLELIAALQDPVTTLLQALNRPWCAYDTCRYPGHDHTTTRSDDGSDLDTRVPKPRLHCCWRAHYDDKLGDDRHDNPDAPRVS
ncbi:hypothetical protein ABZS66_48505 [Dactylosporangium sp. NPDC005572]|uniref:hypothetical protein n=1 Tax=Dactylosporangium sp. NPDC005572 TaxID=3156889 RepID=UPI0033B69A01